MDLPIPYFDLPAHIRSIRTELDAAIARVMDEAAFCLGPFVAEFERAFAAYCHAREVVAFNSGTSALHVAMRVLDLSPGDEVITTPYTFIATSWAILYTGARPVYVDLCPDTLNLDPAQVERAITPRTRAILPVHLYGHPADLGALGEISRRHGIPLIEDAAQAHGAGIDGRKVGTLGALSIFSFYPGKNLGACGEGGALVTNDPAIANRARALREHGSTRRYFHDEIGYNYRMEGIQGAVLNVKLKYLDAWNDRRRRLAARYTELLKSTPLVLPLERPGARHAWHLYVIRHERRDDLKRHLEKHQIGCALHYPVPLHLQKCLEFLGYREGHFPVAESAAQTCLSLPMYPELSDSQVDRVGEVCREFFEQHGA